MSSVRTFLANSATFGLHTVFIEFALAISAANAAVFTTFDNVNKRNGLRVRWKTFELMLLFSILFFCFAVLFTL